MKGSSRPLSKASALSLAVLWALSSPCTPQAFAQNAAIARSAVPVSPVSGVVGASILPLTLPSGLGMAGTDGVSLTSLPGGLSLPAAFTVQAHAAAPSLHSPSASAAAEQRSPSPVLEVRPGEGAAAPAPAPGLSIITVTPAAEQAVLAAGDAAGAARTEDDSRATAPARQSILSRIAKAIRGRSTSDMFTGGRTKGSGILPESAPRQDGLDAAPQMPSETEIPRVGWERHHLPGPAGRPTLIHRLFGWMRRATVEPMALPGNPQDAASVESALRELIRSQPQQYGGLSPDSLYTVLAAKVAGRAGAADTVYVNFIQQHEGVRVEGTYLSFMVRLSEGKAVVIASSAQLYPEVEVDTAGKLGPEQIQAKAAQRLGQPTAEADFLDQGTRVMHLGGAWRAVRLLLSQSKTLIAAVDVNTGETFAWDPRARAAQAPSGEVTGRGIADGPIEGAVPSVLNLGHVEIRTSDGKSFYADAQGRFTVPGEGTDPVELTVRLSGRYASVLDQKGKDLVVTVTAKPGETLQVVFNPQGADEGLLAQVNAYFHTTLVHDWLVQVGIDLDALNHPMPIKTNIDDECNAYYTPYSPSLNFFRSSERCANSSYNDVNYHEFGHGVDDAAHKGIPNGGLSEAIGDMLTMFITGQPVVGRGFIKGGSQDYIRHGENTYKYRSRDEVHDQGQAGMGFAWKLRKALRASLGEAEGSAVATSLVIPAILAYNRDIPAFIQSVLMRDVGADGKAAHYKEIAEAAKAHGITVKEPKLGENGPLVSVDADDAPAKAARAVAAAFRLLTGV